MKRRTLKQLRPKRQPEQHHNVYVVLLNPAVGKLRKVRAENPKRDPKKPCVYVGMTGLTPEERCANHKAGIKAASVVKRYGIRLLTGPTATVPTPATMPIAVHCAGRAFCGQSGFRALIDL